MDLLMDNKEDKSSTKAKSKYKNKSSVDESLLFEDLLFHQMVHIHYSLVHSLYKNILSEEQIMTNLSPHALRQTISRLENEIKSDESSWLPDLFSPSLRPTKTKFIAKVLLLQHLKVIQSIFPI